MGLAAYHARTSMRRIRFALLQKASSPYVDACLRALAATGRAELFVTIPPAHDDAPHPVQAVDWIDSTYPLSSLRRDDGLIDALRDFRPDVTLIVGWEQPAYRRCARALRGTSLRVVCMDNQWLRTPRQLLGIASSRLYLRPYFDAAFLPGPRQLDFALRLGFARDRIFEGFYAADVEAFADVPPLDSAEADARRAFLFAGRLVEVKGIDTLAEAYMAYREAVDDPWPLIIVGRGPLESVLRGRTGIGLRGFVDKAELTAEFARASFLVLPSTFEPWGVVVHEATAAGLGCICTTRVGAADAFVREGENGRIVRPLDVDALTAAIVWAHSLKPEQRATVSRVSRALAEQVTPKRWAEVVLEMAALPD
jgi:glycosyltransferase involved in cell wall biosynthesis